MWFTVALISWILFACLCFLWKTILEDILHLPKTQFLSKAEETSSNVSLAELGLRDAVRRVAREAARLPCLANSATTERRGSSSYGRENDTTYEDLLATAILNKVIDTFQKDNQNTSTTNLSDHHRSNSQRYVYEHSSEFNIDDLERRRIHRKNSLPGGGGIGSDSRSGSYQVNPLQQEFEDDNVSLRSEPAGNFHSGSHYYPRRNLGIRRRKHLSRNVDRETTTGSLSSVEDFVPRHQRDDNFSFLIKQSIDELTSSDIDESYDPQAESDEVSINSRVSSHRSNPLFNSVSLNEINDEIIPPVTQQAEPWEDNWLFQKKKTKTSIMSPVAMLVPNASIEYRALIGDRDAEDTTDLSDIGSDYDEPGKDAPKLDLKSVLVTSRTIIGGKNELDLLNETSIDTSEDVNNVNVSIEIETQHETANNCSDHVDAVANEIDEHMVNDDQIETEPVISSSLNVDFKSTNIDDVDDGHFESISTESGGINETKNPTLLHDSQYSETDSMESNPQKDLEYSEAYRCNESSIKEEPVPAPRKSIANKYNYDSGIDITDPPPFKGKIAEREHKKWENAVPMPNNPYTVENIEKRLKEQRSTSLIALPKVTSLERRNSYKREIDTNEIEPDTISLKSNESLNSATTSEARKSAVWKMFEDIVRDYSPSTDQLTSHEATSQSGHIEGKCNSVYSLNSDASESGEKTYLSTLHYNFDKTQSCINLGENEIEKLDNEKKNSALRIGGNGLQRSSSAANRQNIYLKDAFDSNTDKIKRYGRDYYIREAKRASGSRKVKSDIPSPGVSETAKPQEAQDLLMSSNSNVFNTTLVKIDDTITKSVEEVEVGSLISLSSYGSPSSSLNDVGRVYNINSGAVLYQMPPITANNSETELSVAISKSQTLVIEDAKISTEINMSDNKSINMIHNAEDDISLTSSSEECQDARLCTEDDMMTASASAVLSLTRSSSSSGINNDIEISETSSSPMFSVNSKYDKILKDDEVHPEGKETVKTQDNSTAPTIKERMKAFLSPNNLETETLYPSEDQKLRMNAILTEIKRRRFSEQRAQSYDEEKFHPNHSITARSILYRRSNSTTSQGIPIEMVNSNSSSKQSQTILKNSPDFPRKSLKERCEFFENLNSQK